jgi:peptidoglycan/xylan/chitin deacetylase (PgdA/CDA1 family)
VGASRVININLHGIGEPGRELEPGEDDYWISHAAFLSVLDAVADHPGVRLSFDDGNASDVELALPALTERGLTADFFVLAGRLGTPGSVDADGVRELAAAGMTVGSHGMHHRSWREVRGEDRADEFVEARRVLRDVIGAEVTSAACPRGQYDRRVLADLRRLGYRTVFTSDPRPAAAGGWLQPRFTVRCADTGETVRAAMLAPRPLAERAATGVKGAVKRWR